MEFKIMLPYLVIDYLFVHVVMNCYLEASLCNQLCYQEAQNLRFEKKNFWKEDLG